jgi:hypothetical protein
MSTKPIWVTRKTLDREVSTTLDAVGDALAVVKADIEAAARKRTQLLEAKIATLEAKLAALQAKAGSTMQYCGVWEAGQAYGIGDFVTHAGSLWACRAPTEARPGTSPAWTLAVKRGRDGRDGDDIRSRPISTRVAQLNAGEARA